LIDIWRGPLNSVPGRQRPQICCFGLPESTPLKLKFIPVANIPKLPLPIAVPILPPVITTGTASAVEAEHKSRKGRKNKKARVLDGPLKADEVRRGKGRIMIILLIGDCPGGYKLYPSRRCVKGNA
jgi:hypothetical protein